MTGFKVSKSLLPSRLDTRSGIRASRLLLIGLFLSITGTVALSTLGTDGNSLLLLSAALVAGYLALNIGANDAANNIGTAVGAGALTLGAALTLAAFGELAGTFLASDTVATRLREGLFHQSACAEFQDLARVLLSGMLAGAIWLNLATHLRTPVSGTHSVIGGMLGAGIFANSWASVQWQQIGSFAAIWLITPVVAALVGGAVLQAIEKTITYQPNLIGAARTRVPILISLLALLLSNYFFLDLAPSSWVVHRHSLLASLAFALAVFLVTQPMIYRKAQTIKNNRQGVNKLFTVPLIVAAGFFAFSHGANDVANITAPLATIASLAKDGSSPELILIPGWVLAVGGLGIVVGLLTYGNRLVRTVGSEITEIDKLRAFCIAISAALVVFAATHFGFPVSTTHILVGSIFGVGLLREYRKRNERRTLHKIRKCYDGQDSTSLDQYLDRFQGATLQHKREMLDSLYREHEGVQLNRNELQQMDGLYQQELVKRTLFRRIIAFWLLTLPIAAVMGALLFQLTAPLVQ